MDSSSSRQVKRPRSATPAKGDPAAPTKKKSKTNKSKTKKSKNKSRSNSLEGGGAAASSNTTKTNKPPRESQTASAQGQMMAQMLSTFSKVEQSRFEAFQRARLSPQHVGDWIAACLCHRWNLAGDHRSLRDLVAVGQAPEISLVVASLAKIYAQRIVQTAIQQRGDSKGDHNGGGPLTVEDLRAAHTERQREGLDPGFFLQAADERPVAALRRRQSQLYEQQRLAGLEAQDKYDRFVKEQQEKEEREMDARQEEVPATDEPPAEEGVESMEIDSDGKK